MRPSRFTLVVCGAKWTNHGEVYASRAGHRPGCLAQRRSRCVCRFELCACVWVEPISSLLFSRVANAHAFVEWRRQQRNHVCLLEVSFCDYFGFHFYFWRDMMREIYPSDEIPTASFLFWTHKTTPSLTWGRLFPASARSVSRDSAWTAPEWK